MSTDSASDVDYDDDDDDDDDDVKVYSSFDAWKHGQPNNYGNVMSYQSCNALDVADRSSSGWNDQNCAQTTFWTGQMQRYGHICRYGRHKFISWSLILRLFAHSLRQST